MVPALAAPNVANTVCPPNVPIGVRSDESATMLIRRQSATDVVMSPTAGELVLPLALTTETLKPPSPCTIKAKAMARSLTVVVMVYGPPPAGFFHKPKEPESGTPLAGTV